MDKDVEDYDDATDDVTPYWQCRAGSGTWPPLRPWTCPPPGRGRDLRDPAGRLETRMTLWLYDSSCSLHQVFDFKGTLSVFFGGGKFSMPVLTCMIPVSQFQWETRCLHLETIPTEGYRGLTESFVTIPDTIIRGSTSAKQMSLWWTTGGKGGPLSWLTSSLWSKSI